MQINVLYYWNLILSSRIHLNSSSRHYHTSKEKQTDILVLQNRAELHWSEARLNDSTSNAIKTALLAEHKQCGSSQLLNDPIRTCEESSYSLLRKGGRTLDFKPERLRDGSKQYCGHQQHVDMRISYVRWQLKIA